MYPGSFALVGISEALKRSVELCPSPPRNVIFGALACCFICVRVLSVAFFTSKGTIRLYPSGECVACVLLRVSLRLTGAPWSSPRVMFSLSLSLALSLPPSLPSHDL